MQFQENLESLRRELVPEQRKPNIYVYKWAKLIHVKSCSCVIKMKLLMTQMYVNLKRNLCSRRSRVSVQAARSLRSHHNCFHVNIVSNIRDRKRENVTGKAEKGRCVLSISAEEAQNDTKPLDSSCLSLLRNSGLEVRVKKHKCRQTQSMSS